LNHMGRPPQRKKKWSSRERMLRALECRAADHTPCAFMMYKGLKNECGDYRQFLQAQLDLGLDVVVELPPRPPVVANEHPNLHGLPVGYAPGVQTQERVSTGDEGEKLLTKEYQTPDGVLRVEVPGITDWPWASQIPFLDDHIIAAARKQLVEKPEDLKALRHLLVPPTKEEIDSYREESQPYLEFAREKGLLVAGGWGVGGDMAGWLCGLKELILMTYRRPKFLADLLEMIAEWNRRRMEAAFQMPLDLYVKRAWYENCDFWTPVSWKTYLQPSLKKEVRLAHEAGVKFGYLITSKAMPLIEGIVEAGVDVLIGVDPREYDLETLREKTRGRMCLWGGVNGHLTVETGTKTEVRTEVRRAMRILSPGGGFILSPVDNVSEHTPGIEANVRQLITTWQELR
jgi:hypothetical protein